MAAKLVKPSIMARTEDGSPVVEVFAFEYKDGKARHGLQGFGEHAHGCHYRA